MNDKKLIAKLRHEGANPGLLTLSTRDAINLAADRLEVLSTPEPNDMAKAIVQKIRAHCTPSSEAYEKGGDFLIYAVADWIENPPEWVHAPWVAAATPEPEPSEREAQIAVYPEVEAFLSNLHDTPAWNPSTAADDLLDLLVERGWRAVAPVEVTSEELAKAWAEGAAHVSEAWSKRDREWQAWDDEDNPYLSAGRVSPRDGEDKDND